LVGPDATAQKFHIHADLATQHSEFFNAALKHGWKEASERVVRLPDLPGKSANGFENFHSFLYTGKVYSGYDGEVNRPDWDEEWLRLTYSWIIGEVLLSTTFQDAVVDAIIQRMTVKQDVPLDMYEGIYLHSSNASPIRKLMVDIVVQKWRAKHISDVDTDDDPAMQAKFLQDVAVALFEVKALSKAERAKNRITLESGCLYHEHGADKPCYKTMF
jgi:hypothetical protein